MSWSLDGEPTPRHLDYLDLLKISGNGSLKVDAVAEFQSRPLLYIVSGDQIRNSDNEKMLDLQCLLANRGEMAYLGVLSPGELNVYPINLDRSVLARQRQNDDQTGVFRSPAVLSECRERRFHHERPA